MSSLFCRQHKLFNKELYADFIAAQIKTLSFLAYIIRIYQVHMFHARMLFHSLKLSSVNLSYKYLFLRYLFFFQIFHCIWENDEKISVTVLFISQSNLQYYTPPA